MIHDKDVIWYYEPVVSRGAVRSSSENTSEALVPPKPKLFDTATLTSFCCAWWGTKLKFAPTLGASRLSVGGRVF